MSWTIQDTNRGNEREAESRADAEEVKDDIVALGADPEAIEIIPPDTGDATDEGRQDVQASDGGEVVETAQPVSETTETAAAEDLPDDPPIDTDPVDWLPGHFVDTIEGVPTVNRKGYAVIASKYGISVVSEPETLPSATDWEYAEFTATATAPNGEIYSGFGSAHVDRGDDATLLGELAETRAMKRAVAWASGLGLTAVEELKSEVQA